MGAPEIKGRPSKTKSKGDPQRYPGIKKTNGFEMAMSSVTHHNNVRPPFDSVQLVNITPMSLWFMVLRCT